MSIVRWNPAREIDQFFNHLDRGFGGWGENIATSDWNPAVDIRETDDEYQIDLDLPAVQPADVKVTFKDGVLAVTGEREGWRAVSEGGEARRGETARDRSQSPLTSSRQRDRTVQRRAIAMSFLVE